MFEAVKNNGMGDGKGKTEIYMDMYKQMKSDIEAVSFGICTGI